MVIWTSIFHFPHIFLEDISLPALFFFFAFALGEALTATTRGCASGPWLSSCKWSLGTPDMIGYDWIWLDMIGFTSWDVVGYYPIGYARKQKNILIHNQYCWILLMCVFFIHARCCPSSLAKLVQITPISLWFMVDISILTMAVKKKTITGGHHLASTLVDAWFYDISWWDDHMIFFQPVFPRQQIWVWIKINPPKIDLVDTWRTVTWVPLVLWYSFFSASFFT